MRWQNLSVEEEELRSLPGYRDPAVVRTFDAPEAMDIRFYEIRAKSALNRVPKQSQVPFRWTINPYRGCTHACTYCVSGHTPVLMADGRTRRMADLCAGDEIYGTERRGYRRYVKTRVLDHWSSIKPAYRVTLEDGTELIASGDHRFLTRRGWKHVTGAEQGPNRRPHLTVGGELLGTGKFGEAPEHCVDYRRGYLCGMVRGDGHLGSYSYERPGRSVDDHHRFRLALADEDGLARAASFLATEGVTTTEFQFHAATATTRGIRAVRTSARAHVERVSELTRWPLSPSDAWRKGFLAGIFDAEGSCSGASALCVANCDPAILDWTAACLEHFRFDVVTERTGNPNGLCNVRLRGGLREQLRFFHSVDPAIRRKCDIDGLALKSDAATRVVAIEPLGVTMRLFDVTTGTGDFIADGVVSHNCFARPTHRYLDFDAGRDFEREIVVKVNVPEILRTELAKPSWKGEHVALGTNTDPYQWVEGRYKLMPGIWEAFRDFANPCSVLTKSPLLLRDLPLLKEVAERAPVMASFSVPTLDEKAWRATEPHTPHPRARLEAVAELNRAGIPCGVLVAPLMPGINDAPEQVEPILEMAAEAGATSIGAIALHLRGEVRDVFFDWLRGHRPDLVPRYESLYGRGAYAPPAERKRLQSLVWGRSGRRGIRAMPVRMERAAEPAPERKEPTQESLF